MTEVEARAALANYLQSSPSDTNHPPPASWAGKSPIAEKVGDGRWVFWYSTAGQPEGGIVISPRDDPYHFCGALGKAIPSLGLPRTPERFLGSTVVGRYGVFENGIAVWEGEPDIGFLVPRDLNEVQQGRQCQAIMAFFDLRGFTSWSSGEDRPAAQIQDIVRVLEEEFQAAFAKGWCHRLFTKGTGDGFMIVSEAGWGHGLPDGNGDFQSGHAALFAKACSTLIIKARPQLPEQLAIGCGITIGEITQIFLLGRPDYIGSLVNEAAKIQQLGWDELCVTQDFLEAMKADGMNVRAHRLAVKGWIVDPQECLAAGQAVTRRGEDAGRSLAARGEKTTAEVALFGAISDRVRSVRVRSGKLLTQWLENVSPTDRPGALQDLEALAKELLDLPDQWRHLLRRVHEWLGSNKVIEPNLLRSKLELLLLIDQTTLQEMSRTFSIVSAPQGTLSDGLIAQLNEAATELETLGKETFRHWHKFTTAQEDAARAEMKQGGVEADELFASVAGVTTEEWRKRVANKRATIPQDAGGA